jgi:phosphoribosyl 1,2-cyclic phosphate phosphodiesterase
MARLEGLDTLVLGALRYRPHPTHLSLDEAVAIAERLSPKRTLFTHMCHELDHATVNAQLPKTMELAYDGLRVPLTVNGRRLDSNQH